MMARKGDDPLKLTGSRKEQRAERKRRDALIDSKKRLVADTAPGPYGGREAVTKSARTDRIAWLRSNSKITAEQALVAYRFSGIWERAQIASAGGIDPERIRVDGGGGYRDGIVTSVLQAQQVRREIERALGPRHYAILAMVAGEGLSITEAAMIYADGAWRSDPAGWHELAGEVRAGIARGDRDQVGRMFREALDDLCRVTGAVWDGDDAQRPIRGARDADVTVARSSGADAFTNGEIDTAWADDQAARRARRRP